MTKAEDKAKAEINAILYKVGELLGEATEIADAAKVEFEYKPSMVGTYTPGHPEWEASDSGCEWETSDGPWIDGEWSLQYVDWESSSLRC
jgi:hypothetical protein